MLQVMLGTCPFKVNLVTTLLKPTLLCSDYEGTIATHKSFPKMTWVLKNAPASPRWPRRLPTAARTLAGQGQILTSRP